MHLWALWRLGYRGDICFLLLWWIFVRHFQGKHVESGRPRFERALRGSGIKAHIPVNDISAEEHTEVWAVRENPQTTGQGWTWSGAEVRVLE